LQAPLHGLCITHGVFISFSLIDNHVDLRPWQQSLSFGRERGGSYSTAQHSTIQYSTVQDLFRTASFTHKRDFLYRVFFIVIGWIPRGTCMGFFLRFGGGEVDGVMYI